MALRVAPAGERLDVLRNEPGVLGRHQDADLGHAVAGGQVGADPVPLVAVLEVDPVVTREAERDAERRRRGDAAN